MERKSFAHGRGEGANRPADGSRDISAVRLFSQAGSRRSSKVDRYDFGSQEKLSQDQWKFLQKIYDQFAEYLAPALTPALQARVFVELRDIRLVPYKELLDSLPRFPVLVTADIDDQGKGLWIADWVLSSALVDRLMGGRGESSEEQRDFTAIERAVFEKNFFSKVLETWAGVWKEIAPVQSRVTGIEFDPHHLLLFPYGEQMVVTGLQVKVGGIEGGLSLAIPYKFMKVILPRSLEEYMSKVVTPAKVDAPPSPFFSKKIEVSELPVTVELGTAEVFFQDLLNVEVGDVIKLQEKIQDPVRIRIGGQAKFLGKPGVRENKVAVQIISVLPEGEEG